MTVHYRRFDQELSFLKSIPSLEVLIDPHFVELPMLAALFTELIRQSDFESYRWLIVTCHHDFNQVQTTLNQDCVLVYLSNEDGLLPACTSQVKAVFTPYCRQWPLPAKVSIIPLGCNGDLPEPTWIPFEERQLDVFFSGQAIPQRGPFILAAMELLAAMQTRSHFQGQITLSSQFRGGLSPELYSQSLMNSKIALLPVGFSPITFRFFEAMRSGCLLVTHRLPPFWYLDGLPLLHMPLDWHDLSDKIMALLMDSEYQLELHQRTRWHYQNKLSPQAVAQYMFNQLAVS